MWRDAAVEGSRCVQAERQKALLATAAVAGTTSGGGGGELRCENSERVFQRKWWGRRVPLEPDPRKIAAASMSPGPEGAALSGLQLDDRPGVWECGAPYARRVCGWLCACLLAYLLAAQDFMVCNMTSLSNRLSGMTGCARHAARCPCPAARVT